MKELSVYILKCSDDSYYTGVKNDVERRLYEHNHSSKDFSYTNSRKPITLVWQCAFQSNMEAIRWEKRIKGWSRKKKEALIAGHYDLLHDLSECQNESHSGNFKSHASTPLSMTKETPLSMTKETPLSMAKSNPLSTTHSNAFDVNGNVTLSNVISSEVEKGVEG
jgi:putative endonuclease